MARKRINPAHMRSVEVSFTTVTENSPEDVKTLVDSSATDIFVEASGLVKTVIEDLKIAVNNLDEFLNTMADEMEKADLNLQREIQGDNATAKGYAQNMKDATHYDKSDQDIENDTKRERAVEKQKNFYAQLP